MREPQIALLVEAVISARERAPDPHQLLDLVLSGPDVPGIPMAGTAAVMRTLFEEATSEVLLVGYVIHNAEQLFAPLAEKMHCLASLKVVFCLDIPRHYTDTSLSGEIVHRFAYEFRTKHWPWPDLPQLYYDPRSLDESTTERSSLHAKCLVIDRRVALVTSANFTEAAQDRNIEAGVLIRYAPLAERLANYFDALRRSGQLLECRLA
jgi:phosphatidylserine/phosphatidylglycerophosphate/cardiolipin synthase-like enzyme